MAKAGLENCRCGSKLYAPARYDGHMIFLTYACDTCWPKKRAGYREDIMTQYEADEPIEDDEYRGPDERYAGEPDSDRWF
jgi:hypothetical protein